MTGKTLGSIFTIETALIAPMPTSMEETHSRAITDSVTPLQTPVPFDSSQGKTRQNWQSSGYASVIEPREMGSDAAHLHCNYSAIFLADFIEEGEALLLTLSKKRDG